MWLIIVSLLACFDINKAKDEFGNEIEIDHTYMVEGMVTYVKRKTSVFLILILFFFFCTDIRNLSHALSPLDPRWYEN